jgi:hypothetical protein
MECLRSRLIVSDRSRAVLTWFCHCSRLIREGSGSGSSCAKPLVGKSAASPQIAILVAKGFIY